jgi:F-type H+-transporting ATPase subunit epsilon
MSGINLSVVTAERVVYSGNVNAIIVPGSEGKLGILPGHAPLMALLRPGELELKENNGEVNIKIFGGFLEVRPDRVIILADTECGSE